MSKNHHRDATDKESKYISYTEWKIGKYTYIHRPVIKMYPILYNINKL